MRLQEHHMPHMKGMELGKRYHIHAEIEPTELSTGESEYGYEGVIGPGGSKTEKPPMTGRFKVHTIHSMDQKATKGKKPSAKSARYE